MPIFASVGLGRVAYIAVLFSCWQIQPSKYATKLPSNYSISNPLRIIWALVFGEYLPKYSDSASYEKAAKYANLEIMQNLTKKL